MKCVALLLGAKITHKITIKWKILICVFKWCFPFSCALPVHTENCTLMQISDSVWPLSHLWRFHILLQSLSPLYRSNVITQSKQNKTIKQESPCDYSVSLTHTHSHTHTHTLARTHSLLFTGQSAEAETSQRFKTGLHLRSYRRNNRRQTQLPVLRILPEPLWKYCEKSWFIWYRTIKPTDPALSSSALAEPSTVLPRIDADLRSV